mmetsp:Transcript_78746/g.118387  ORF Transcript_78746/g.118387 Transcript_78746/m.118387 type:complete len:83 (-) Transcript_78746:16-264(-)
MLEAREVGVDVSDDDMGEQRIHIVLSRFGVAGTTSGIFRPTRELRIAFLSIPAAVLLLLPECVWLLRRLDDLPLLLFPFALS